MTFVYPPVGDDFEPPLPTPANRSILPIPLVPLPPFPDQSQVIADLRTRGTTFLPSGEFTIIEPTLTYRDALRMSNAIRRSGVSEGDAKAVLRVICQEFDCSPAQAQDMIAELSQAHEEIGEVMETQMPYVVVFECENGETRYLGVEDSGRPFQTTMLSVARLWTSLTAMQISTERFMREDKLTLPNAEMVFMQVSLVPLGPEVESD